MRDRVSLLHLVEEMGAEGPTVFSPITGFYRGSILYLIRQRRSSRRSLGRSRYPATGHAQESASRRSVIRPVARGHKSSSRPSTPAPIFVSHVLCDRRRAPLLTLDRMPCQIKQCHYDASLSGAQPRPLSNPVAAELTSFLGLSDACPGRSGAPGWSRRAGAL